MIYEFISYLYKSFSFSWKNKSNNYLTIFCIYTDGLKVIKVLCYAKSGIYRLKFDHLVYKFYGDDNNSSFLLYIDNWV
jgi:hypothetical protein